ncbi:hypothetical protein HRM2_26090 [Desulforapulum autotrophicum HRM2]|uniref:Uncharacterized protein n=1 Tax=Desulforapulum autotrophicum (strain ATCC 43914 / DSM 3382 / VKM B-1955 / HRM2) TaxID=177437 RepID=C0QH54_DESAH|nr:hypothetical protein [Desulforapulum autotrophicum]ACN15703.1 hypothetical protein HRM2_26090 [Desulforapulum autotrophicum HRM2]
MCSTVVGKKNIRNRTLERIEKELTAFEKQSGKAQLKTKYALMPHRSMGRYLKEFKSGKLKVDRSKVKREAKLRTNCFSA